MKLLMCNDCSDVFSLRYEVRNCVCGKSGGHYLEDGLHAVIWGECIALGFANDSFVTAIKDRPMSGRGKEFTAFVIPVECSTVEHVTSRVSKLLAEIVAEIREIEKLSSSNIDNAIEIDVPTKD